jgi:hypothetical protein
VYNPPVPQGPRAYRRQIRSYGPMLGLVPPALMGAIALLLLRGNTSSTMRGVLGFLLAVLAAPGLLVGGAPLASGGMYLLAIAGSAVLWAAIGIAATRRATRTPVATWGDFWKDYLSLAGAVWLGTVAALVAANLILGGAFL